MPLPSASNFANALQNINRIHLQGTCTP